MKQYLYGTNELNNHSSKTFEIAAKGLVKEGYIEEDKIDEILGTYRVLIQEKGIFGTMWDKVFEGTEEGSLAYRFIKLI